MTGMRRVQAVRARARIQRWEFRQRNLARGSWGRFRTALAHAESVYAIDRNTVQLLTAEGFCCDSAGRDLEPPRSLIWITADRAAQLAGARPLVVRLDATMLASPYLALVPFA